MSLAVFDYCLFAIRPQTHKYELLTAQYRIQPEVKDPKAFFPGAIPFNKEQYKSLVKEMRLPAEAIDGTSVVGPFFWWAYVEEPGNPSDSHLRETLQQRSLVYLGQILTDPPTCRNHLSKVRWPGE